MFTEQDLAYMMRNNKKETLNPGVHTAATQCIRFSRGS